MAAGRVRRTIERVLELGGAGLAVFAAGVVVGGLIVFGLHQKHWPPGGGTRQVEAFSEVGEPQAGQLAERFRPWLMFDSHEPWRPLNVSLLLDEGKHRFCTRLVNEVRCTPIRSASAFDALTKTAGALGPATYLDLGGGSVRDYHGPGQCAPLLTAASGLRRRSTTTSPNRTTASTSTTVVFALQPLPPLAAGPELPQPGYPRQRRSATSTRATGRA